MHKVIITYSNDGHICTPVNEPKLRQQWTAILAPKGFEIDSVIPSPLWFDASSKRSKGHAICLDDPEFPKISVEDLDAINGKYILYTYSLCGLDARYAEDGPLDPVSLRKFVQESIRPNASTKIWTAILKHPAFRTVLTEKQAGAFLGKRLKNLLSRNPKADWQADPGVQFYLLGKVDAAGIIRALFAPKKDFETGEMQPVDDAGIQRGVAILRTIKSRLGLADDFLQAQVLKVLSQNVNWWTEKGLTLHDSVNRVQKAQDDVSL
jgi:hypothetical protein